VRASRSRSLVEQERHVAGVRGFRACEEVERERRVVELGRRGLALPVFHLRVLSFALRLARAVVPVELFEGCAQGVEGLVVLGRRPR